MEAFTPLCEQGNPCPHYDIIIVGAGISGLYVTRELLKRYPSYRIALAERYKGLGGRTYSYWPPEFKGIHWEMGAGRIHKDHTLVLRLLKEYGLHWIPIGSEIGFLGGGRGKVEPNPFESVFVPVFLEPLSRLPKGILEGRTIEELMTEIYGAEKTRKILETFPYRAEVNTLRADLALDIFLRGEMKNHNNYGYIREGFSELVARMRADIEARGATILQRHRLMNLRKAGGGATDLDFQFGYENTDASGKITLRADQGVVLALHRDAVAEFPVFSDWKTLSYLKTQPLLRTYAIFPNKSGKSWFTGFGRIVTPTRPRYILPIDASKGVIMISYKDADDAREYMKIQKRGGDTALESVIMKDVRRLFPEMKIPDPLFFRSHPWETGATYWLPGVYDPFVQSERACRPLPQILPNVWLCGESWSTRQAWVEGALEHAAMCLKKIRL